MTAIAVRLGLTVLSREMALLAWCRRVHSDEREAGHVMVEQDVVIPAFLVMAAVTLLTLLTIMDVIFLMTAEAAGLQLLFVDIRFMALLTADLFMLSEQGEIGLFAVVEFMFAPR